MEYRELRRARIKKAKDLYKLPPGPLKSIDISQTLHNPPGMTRAYSNNRYMVMIYDNTVTTMGKATKALIQRLDDTPIPNHWSEIQKIKNEIFGAEITGIEYYPAESKLINNFNIYWLWIFPDGILPLAKI